MGGVATQSLGKKGVTAPKVGSNFGPKSNDPHKFRG